MDRPPDAICLDTLVLKGGFTQSAATTFLRVYDETLAYAGMSDSDKEEEEMGDAPESPEGEKSAMQTTAAVMGRQNPPPAPPRGSSPWRVTLTPDGVIEVVGRLESEVELDDLMEILSIHKPVFKMLAKRLGAIESEKS